MVLSLCDLLWSSFVVVVVVAVDMIMAVGVAWGIVCKNLAGGAARFARWAQETKASVFGALWRGIVSAL